MVRVYTRAFFDKHLLNQPSTPLDQSAVGELELKLDRFGPTSSDRKSP